jgi:lipoprotein-anchoring transpeptidase ErfK/SrfK
MHKLIILPLLAAGTLFCTSVFIPSEKEQPSKPLEVSSQPVKKIYPKMEKEPIKTPVAEEVKPVNWLLPTGGAYPTLTASEQIWIRVSKADQKVYLMNGENVIYTMICSSGMDTNPDTSTPEGTFYIEKERGLNFYNAREKEGANYWVSWKNHGEFLFHTVPTDINGKIIESEAVKLGHKASHGCIRLSVADAKWIYDNIKYNTKVVIS